MAGILRGIKKQLKAQKKIKPIQKPENKVKKKTIYRYKLQCTEEEKILLVGEGNFSFALSLSEIVHGAYNMICTSFDSRDTMLKKYPESDEITKNLEEMGGTIMYNVDATKLIAHAVWKKKRFSKIIFNFPHAGKGICDQDHNIRTNQELINGFFASAREKLMDVELGDERDGEIVVTVKTGLPYELWNIKQLAAANSLVCSRSFEFCPADYPGYEHRRTLGLDTFRPVDANSEITKKPSRTFVYQKIKESL